MGAKLKIRRCRNHWVIEQDGLMVDWAWTFCQACLIAQQWKQNGWYVAKGWTK